MILLFIAAILFFVLQNISFKQFNLVYMKNKSSYFIFNAIYFTLICVIFGFLGVDPSRFTYAIAWLGMLFSISFITAVFSYMKAMENGPLSLSFLFFSAGMLVPIVFGILFFNEPAPIHKFAGLALLFAAFFVSTLGSGGKKMNPKWVVYILIASLSNGVIGVSLKLCNVVSEDASKEFLFFGFGQAAIISLLIGLFLMNKHKEQLSHFRALPFCIIAATAAVTTAGGNYIMLLLSSMVSALVQFPVVNGSLIITSILTSRVVFKEEVTKQQLLAILIGLVSIVLLSL